MYGGSAVALIIAAACLLCSASSIASEDMPLESEGDLERRRMIPDPVSAPLTTGEGCPDATLSRDGLSVADELLRSVTLLRELPVNEPVVSCALPREQLRARFLTLFDRDSDMEQIRREGELLRLLGFIDPNIEFIDLILSLLEDEVVGFFDPVDERLYVIPSDSAEYDQMTLAHEFVHALQHQSFDLESLMDPSLLISDPMSSRSALIEGDAIVAGLAVASGLEEMSGVRPAILRRVSHSMWQTPPSNANSSAYLMRALVAPYAAGTSFVASLIEEDGWRAVDRAFERLPTSTEQILHPEKYANPDEPTWLEFAPLVSVCETRTYVDIRGEFDFRNVLAELLGTAILDEVVVNAAAGWDGDRLEIWDDCFGGAEIVVHASVWDSEADADEYLKAATRAFSAWLDHTRVPSLQGATTAQVVQHPSGFGARAYAFSEGRGYVLERWGDQVVLAFVDSSDPVLPEQLTGLVSHVSETLTRFSYPLVVTDPTSMSR